LLIGFVFAIASAACSLLYLKTMNTWLQKKKKKKKRPRDRIFMQPSKYFSILKILQYDYALLSLYTPLLYESLRSKDPETIVIVSTGRLNIELL